jgi:hypothetical protein
MPSRQKRSRTGSSAPARTHVRGSAQAPTPEQAAAPDTPATLDVCIANVLAVQNNLQLLARALGEKRAARTKEIESRDLDPSVLAALEEEIVASFGQLGTDLQALVVALTDARKRQLNE